MKKNMGGADRIIRFVVAAVIGLLYWQGIIEGTLAYVLFAVAGVFVGAAAIVALSGSLSVCFHLQHFLSLYTRV